MRLFFLLEKINFSMQRIVFIKLETLNKKAIVKSKIILKKKNKVLSH